jgi:aspartokinase/homoserine dehydrogenase 1
VDGADERDAVRAIHEAFFSTGVRDVDVVLAGVGGVGGALLRQMVAQGDYLARTRGLRLRLTAVSNSRGRLADAAGIDPSSVDDRLQAEGTRTDDDAWWSFVRGRGAAERIFADCTASAHVASRYAELLGAGLTIVAANKLAFARTQTDFDRLRTFDRERLRHETTVGAALPVLGPLEDLVATGDRVRRIDGLLSGTLGFLLTEVARGRLFSESLREAHRLGYTEPDPREDLGGRDVARKILILARIAGWSLEPEAVSVQSLLPDGWESLSLDEFWTRLPELDAEIARRHDSIAQAGEHLVYLATFEDGIASVAPTGVGAAHPASSVSGTDSLVCFTTDRYASSPLVIRGPGAGPELTASGVFADLLRAARGARRGYACSRPPPWRTSRAASTCSSPSPSTRTRCAS